MARGLFEFLYPFVDYSFVAFYKMQKIFADGITEDAFSRDFYRGLAEDYWENYGMLVDGILSSDYAESEIKCYTTEFFNKYTPLIRNIREYCTNDDFQSFYMEVTPNGSIRGSEQTLEEYFLFLEYLKRYFKRINHKFVHPVIRRREKIKKNKYKIFISEDGKLLVLINQMNNVIYKL